MSDVRTEKRGDLSRLYCLGNLVFLLAERESLVAEQGYLAHATGYAMQQER